MQRRRRLGRNCKVARRDVRHRSARRSVHDLAIRHVRHDPAQSTSRIEVITERQSRPGRAAGDAALRICAPAALVAASKRGASVAKPQLRSVIRPIDRIVQRISRTSSSMLPADTGRDPFLHRCSSVMVEMRDDQLIDARSIASRNTIAMKAVWARYASRGRRATSETPRPSPGSAPGRRSSSRAPSRTGRGAPASRSALRSPPARPSRSP